jgi:hypothetical protein
MELEQVIKMSKFSYKWEEEIDSKIINYEWVHLHELRVQELLEVDVKIEDGVRKIFNVI